MIISIDVYMPYMYSQYIQAYQFNLQIHFSKTLDYYHNITSHMVNKDVVVYISLLC